MPVSNGFRHLLTIVDRFTRWPVAVPISNISAETVLDALAQQWIASFGVPEAITTDRGTQFTSGIWTQLLSTWGIKHHPTTAYHLQANGMVERFHRRLKESLMAACGEQPEHWFWKLPTTLLALRTTLKPDISASPADLVFGEGLPGELVAPHADATTNQQRRQTLAHLKWEVARLQPTPSSAHCTPHMWIPESLAEASHIFIRRGGVHPTLTTPYQGPYKVASRGALSYKIHLPGRGIDAVAIERLKPAFVSRDNDGTGQDPDEEAPPPPPPPGRCPGRRTHVPAPPVRATRARPLEQNTSRAPPSASSEMSATAERGRTRTTPTSANREPRLVSHRLEEEQPAPSGEQPPPQVHRPRAAPTPPPLPTIQEEDEDIHHSFFNFADEMHNAPTIRPPTEGLSGETLTFTQDTPSRAAEESQSTSRWGDSEVQDPDPQPPVEYPISPPRPVRPPARTFDRPNRGKNCSWMKKVNNVTEGMNSGTHVDRRPQHLRLNKAILPSLVCSYLGKPYRNEGGSLEPREIELGPSQQN